MDPSELSLSTVTHAGKPPSAESAAVPGLTILSHPDARRVGERVALPELTSGRKVNLSRRAPRFASPRGESARPLADVHLSRKPVTLEPDPAGNALVIATPDGGGRLVVGGAEVRKRRRLEVEALGQGVTLLLADRVVLLLHWLDPSPADEDDGLALIGESPAIVRLRRRIRQVSGRTAPVLLLGETGTGKELAARAIHRGGARRDGPFVCADMGAVPPALAAAELFGTVEAPRERLGYLRRADGGTLFLDEVAAAPPEVQAMLSRVLETQEVRPVGTDGTVHVDVRIIAATHADLEEAIAQGRFLAHLRHRLSGCQLHLPPLRERREDLGRLLYHFLAEELEAAGEPRLLDPVGPREPPWLAAGLVDRLARHDWPGNVRELRNVAGQLVISGRGERVAELERLLDELLRDHRPSPLRIVRADTPPTTRGAASEEDFLARVCHVIDENLDDEDFDVDTLAAHLAMSKSSLYLRLEGLTERKPAQLVLERRLERAAKLLDDPELSVSEVAFKVGFRSVSHFSQRFREARGVTPSSFRRRA